MTDAFQFACTLIHHAFFIAINYLLTYKRSTSTMSTLFSKYSVATTSGTFIKHKANVYD